MKSYIQGLITGGVLVFAIMVLIGANDYDSESGRYAISTTSAANFHVYETIIDMKTGKVISRKDIHTANFEKFE